MNRFRALPNSSLVRHDERGVTILLVAIAMIFMVLAIAAIAIDVGAMYTARAEAKHAADAAALAGAKVLANSGMTSDPTNTTLQGNAKTLASQIATSVATQNEVGGRNLASGEVTVSFPNLGLASFLITPQVKVVVQRTDFPTFFAKAWGRSTVAVGATSVAEAVNPSDSGSVSASGDPIPIAPSCVKPWIIPNLDPNNPGANFFTPNGAIVSTGMVGKLIPLSPACTPNGCTVASPPAPLALPTAGSYYSASFAAPPSNQEPACTPSACSRDYEDIIAACSPQPITCGVPANAAVDTSTSCGGNYNGATDTATSCLIHSLAGNDTITLGGGPPVTQPPTFVAGTGNPLVLAGKVSNGSQISTSDSLVTIPVYDQTASTAAPNVNIIGFIQGFIVCVGSGCSPPLPSGQIQIRVVNLSGCGTSPSGPPVIGDGISPVPVHLITPP